MKERYLVVNDSISKWKINNSFENWLSYRADKSEFWKRIYVLFYNLLSHKYYVKGVELAKKEIKHQWDTVEEDVKPDLKESYLIRDMIYSLHRFGADFVDYFIYRFYELNAMGRSRFNTLKRQYGYCQLVNNPKVRDLFEDKGALYRQLKPYFKRDLVAVYGPEQKTDLTDFLSKHTSFIYKPLKGYSGHGISIYYDCTMGDKFYDQVIANGPFVLEELIVQGEEMAKLHKQSINTVRLATFKINDDVHIFGAALRIGVGSSSVDNAGSGGIYASIDIKNGIVNSMACDKVNHTYSIHPHTSCKIVGFELPEWDKALSLVTEIHRKISDAFSKSYVNDFFCGGGVNLIAWDLAYSKDGWLLIEGNDAGNSNLLQHPLNKGIKPKIEKLMGLYFNEYSRKNQ